MPLGDTVTAGTQIEFDVQGAVERWAGVPLTAPTNDALRASVLTALEPYAQVYDITLTSGTLADSYNGHVLLAMRGDYGSIEDVKSIVRGVFWQAAHEMPIVTSPTYGDPSPSKTPGPLDDLGSVLKWAALLAVAGGAIYVTSKVT